MEDVCYVIRPFDLKLGLIRICNRKHQNYSPITLISYG